MQDKGQSVTRSLALGAALAVALAGCEAAPPPPAARTTGVRSVELANVSLALARLPEFGKLRAALRSTGLAPTLVSAPAITLLAPRDTAFALIPTEERAALLAPENGAALMLSLRSMMLPRLLRADELRTLIRDGGGSVTMPSMAGRPLTFTLSEAAPDEIVVTSATGATATMGTQEIGAGNGAIYVLDRWIG